MKPFIAASAQHLTQAEADHAAYQARGVEALARGPSVEARLEVIAHLLAGLFYDTREMPQGSDITITPGMAEAITFALARANTIAIDLALHAREFEALRSQLRSDAAQGVATWRPV